MPNYKQPYVVTGIRAQGDPRQIQRTFHGAPSNWQIAVWLIEGTLRVRGRDTKNSITGAFRLGAPFRLAVRYFSSVRGWKILDLRQARRSRWEKQTGWSGIEVLPTIYPNEDAAVMVAVHMLRK